MKRLLDVAVAFVAIVVLSPLLLLVAIAVRVTSPGPAVFRQRRVGRHCKIFEMYKFRTMRDDAPHDVPTHLLAGPAQHVTPVGRVLRKTSLDELPQLFNILKGDMSFVGPRPALWNQDDLVAEREKYGANDVRPGLTGWAQVNGRDELPVAQKAALDGFYVKHSGLLMDARCIAKTIVAVLKADGVRDGLVAGLTGEEGAAEHSCADTMAKTG